MERAAKAEQLFDTNLASYTNRIRKIKARSSTGLDILWAENAKFDVIYVDANHARWYVLADTILSWPLLKVGGLIIFDLFAYGFGECFQVVHYGYQVMLRKTPDWPEKLTSRRPPVFLRHAVWYRVHRKLAKLRGAFRILSL